MPLQIEAPPKEENPEVAALKEKVRQLAKEHSEKFHCGGGWKQALREVGIVDFEEERIRVDITFTVSGSAEQHAVKTYKVSDLFGKSDDEQKAFVAADIAPKVVVAGTTVTLPVEVIDLNKAAKDALSTNNSAQLDAPHGYYPVFTSDEGRVAHLIRLPDNLDDIRAQHGRPTDEAFPEHIQVETILNRWLRDPSNRRRADISSPCGQVNTYYGATLTFRSGRSEGRICQQCERHAERNPVDA